MSIKTEIEWFNFTDILPEVDGQRVLFKTNAGYIYSGNCNIYEDCYEFQPDGLPPYYLGEIKYWAYLPQFPEVE